MKMILLSYRELHISKGFIWKNVYGMKQRDKVLRVMLKITVIAKAWVIQLYFDVGGMA